METLIEKRLRLRKLQAVILKKLIKTLRSEFYFVNRKIEALEKEGLTQGQSAKLDGKE